VLVDIDFVEILQTRVIHLPLTNQGLVSSFRYFSPIRFNSIWYYNLSYILFMFNHYSTIIVLFLYTGMFEG